jgi:caffeoyl-CoA O-methyltransferase
VLDNVLRGGRVLDPQDAADRAVAGLNDHIVADDRVDSVMLPVRDGVTLVRKRD